MENEFSQIAALIGDPVRSKILWTLLDGRAYTATELAIYADTTAPNISMHLHKLVKADLLSAESQGRHRYYKYAKPDIAYVVEAIASLIPKRETDPKNLLADKPIRYCRTCYDHLAGNVGVRLTESLLSNIWIVKQGDSFQLSAEGEDWFTNFGIDVKQLKLQKRKFARACLDWSERKHHLAGALGAALLNQMIANSWLKRTKNSRAMIITGQGRQAFFDHFKIDIT